jgi:hypothetical protein
MADVSVSVYMHHSTKEIAAHTLHISGFIIHSVVYAVVMLIVLAIAISMRSLGFFVAAAAGWGLVMFFHAAYVFLFEEATMDDKDRDITVKTVAEETKQAMPIAS